MNKLLTLLTIGQHLLGQKDRVDKNIIHWSWYVVVSILFICAAVLTYLIAIESTSQKMAVVIAGFSVCVIYCIGYAAYRYFQYLKFKKMKQFALSTADELYKGVAQVFNSVDREVVVKTVVGGIALVIFTKLLKKVF